jgi:hypothetical protein
MKMPMRNAVFFAALLLAAKAALQGQTVDPLVFGP